MNGPTTHNNMNKNTVQERIYKCSEEAGHVMGMWIVKRIVIPIVFSLILLLNIWTEGIVFDSVFSDPSVIVELLWTVLPAVSVLIALILLIYHEYNSSFRCRVLKVSETSIEYTFDDNPIPPPRGFREKLGRIAGVVFHTDRLRVSTKIDWANVHSISVHGNMLRLRGNAGGVWGKCDLRIPLRFEHQTELAKTIVQHCPKVALKCTYDDLVRLK